MRLKNLLLTLALLSLSLCAVKVSAQWSGQNESGVPGCGFAVPGSNMGSLGVPNGCAPGVPSAVTNVTPLTPCTSTGIFNLSNTCNDIYFIGALK